MPGSAGGALSRSLLVALAAGLRTLALLLLALPAIRLLVDRGEAASTRDSVFVLQQRTRDHELPPGRPISSTPRSSKTWLGLYQLLS